MENLYIQQLEAFGRTLPNIDVVESRLPSEVFEIITNEIENPSKELEQYNKNLLGHVKEEYSLNHIKDEIEEYFIQIAQQWTQNNPGVLESSEEVRKATKWDFMLEDIWVNKQKKYEFNPMHLHSGVLSFVIYVKIPYDLEEENKVFPDTTGGESHTSKFYFAYSDILGRQRQLTLPVDKSWEGVMIMFPATLNHGVNPFYTSDEYRITVSGNMAIKVHE